jgi:hypothetical protein
MSHLGVYEALELRDGGSDYLGKGVLKVLSLYLSIIQFCDVFQMQYICALFLVAIHKFRQCAIYISFILFNFRLWRM